MTEEPEAFFAALPDGRFDPRPVARSPWSTEMLHGRLLAALAARAVDQRHREPGMMPARLTIDLFRSPPMAPVQISSRVVRDGNRLRVVDVDLSCDGSDVARATVLLLRQADQPPSEVWSPPGWTVPSPDELAAPTRRSPIAMEVRSLPGEGMGAPGPKRAWLRDALSLVDGEDLTPFVRAAAAADYASPLGNSGAGGLWFINADITLHLHRLPVGEWIGFEVTSHMSSDGVAYAQCRLHDVEGPIGASAVSAVANTPARRRQADTGNRPATAPSGA